MTFRRVSKVVLLIWISALVGTQAGAQSAALMNAVAFALTGNDASPVHVIDQANCVFMIRPESVDGKVVGEIFHLNNVQTDRITIQPFHNAIDQWLRVELRGASTVYEYTGNHPEWFADPLYRMSTGRPREASSYTLTLSTTEYDRMVRAYQYIYQHGCKGSKSLF